MIYELFTNKHWMVMPQFVHGLLPTLMHNFNNHIAIGAVEKKQPYLVAGESGEVIRDSQVTEDGEVIPRYDGWGQDLLAQMKEPFVNVIPIDGPITRNGDACSYGSKDIRDWMMQAADNKYCRAHIMVINTPGGSAWAKNDFQQAIDYAHDCGQRVYMLIDGLCASAGEYLTSFGDEVYVVNLKDQLGCVGVMAAFFTIKNGEKNQFDSETYREYYATKSVNKNKEYRDIAENDDATLLIEELDKLEAEFRSDMKAAFPNATDEHLDGKIFDASEVMGILCDGQMLLGDLVARAFAVANGDEEPIARTANRKIAKPEDAPEEEDDPMAAALRNLDAAAKGVASIAAKNNVSPINSTTMTDKKYQKIAQLLGVDELVVTEEGTFLNTPLLDTLESKLDEMQKANAPAPAQEAQDPEPKAEDPAPAAEDPAPAAEPEPAPAQEDPAPAADPEPEPEPEPSPAQEEDPASAADPEPEPEPAPAQEEDPAPAADPEPEPAPAPAQEAVEGAQAEIDRITDTLHNAEAMVEQKDKEINDLKAAADQKEIDFKAKDETIASLTKERDDANASIKEKDEEIDKLKKQVEDLKAEVKELSEKPAPMINAGAGIPAGNGTGEAPKYEGAVKSEIKPDMSVDEIRKRLREKDEKQKTYRH